ncbi:MAG: TonB-dependent receptor [Sphingomonas sp.]
MGPLSWIVGAYYYKESTYILRNVKLNGLTPGGIINLPDFILDETGSSRTIAGFGSATYAVLPEFRVTAGARYTDDRKAGTKVTRGNFGQPFPPDIPNAQFSGISTFDKFNWKLGLEWDAAPRRARLFERLDRLQGGRLQHLVGRLALRAGEHHGL